MTEVQITIQLPDQVESMEQLEAVIDAKGQQIKPQLFEHQLASLIQRQKPVVEAVACSEYQKKSNFQRLPTALTKDQIRPCFLYPTAVEVPTLWPIIPAEQWLPGRFEGFSRSQYQPRSEASCDSLCRRLALSTSPAKYSAADRRLHQSRTNPSTLFAGSG